MILLGVFIDLHTVKMRLRSPSSLCKLTTSRVAFTPCPSALRNQVPFLLTSSALKLAVARMNSAIFTVDVGSLKSIINHWLVSLICFMLQNYIIAGLNICNKISAITWQKSQKSQKSRLNLGELIEMRAYNHSHYR